MVACLLVCLLAAGPVVTAESLGGASVRGELRELNDSLVVLTDDSGEVRLTGGDLLQLSFAEADGAPPSGAAAVEVRLVDGSQLYADGLSQDGETLVLARSNGGELRLPLEAVGSVRWLEATDELQSQWTDLLQQNAASDVLVVRKRDALDHLEGQIGPLSAERVEFRLDGESLNVKRERVAGLIFFRPRPDVATAKCSVLSRDGQRLSAAACVWSADGLRVTTCAGPEVVLAPGALARLDFSQGKLTYLSAVQPESSTWTPLLGGDELAPYQGPRFDRGALQPQLLLGGRAYARGLALHSRTELVYRLTEPCTRLEALAGIDDSVGDAGHVRLTIWGDDRVLWEGDVRGEDAPQPLSLDLTGVKRLRILVDFGDDLDAGDLLNLAEARIVK